MANSQLPIVGLIGGVGSGKSAVARWLAEHLHGRIVDADAVGHAVLKRDDVKSRLRDAFGEEILQDGEVSRPRVAARVFGGSPEQFAARRMLESIVHPIMREVFEREFREAREASGVELIVFDAALLVDSSWADAVDVVAFVDVPADERLRRVAAGRGWSAEDLRRREASQLSLEEKRNAADVVIDNSGTVEAAVQQLEAYLRREGFLSPVSDRSDATETVANGLSNQLIN